MQALSTGGETLYDGKMVRQSLLTVSHAKFDEKYGAQNILMNSHFSSSFFNGNGVKYL